MRRSMSGERKEGKEVGPGVWVPAGSPQGDSRRQRDRFPGDRPGSHGLE